jgi:lipopolysaccharide assembly outer membrane protein LptD (OstA)
LEFRQKGQLTIYRNGVLVKKGEDWMKASEAVSNENTGEIILDGAITAYYLTDTHDEVFLRARSARYNKNTRTGLLYGDAKAIMKHSSNEGRLDIATIYADKVYIDEKHGTFEARSRVYITNAEADMWADRAVYNRTVKTLTISEGAPFIAILDRQDNSSGGVSIYESDRITVLTESKEIIFDGRVKNIVWGSMPNAGSKKPK